ncbi:het domain-containing protein [Colletotrichum karsti]|uniref:Het domain-containing protein n=1 Tax=Colletotrichum karsti TaxID=1095194 RepID=A0A9P6LGL9_9PEZI|nr:het domain-containing protein [Colletotrichum karsti]KAF9872326.1 het domain-containing protein [Colletotrichum karsti]
MPCAICHDFTGPALADTGGRHRNHLKLDIPWQDFVTSAKSCRICEIILRGSRGCFLQHEVKEPEIVSCSISFLYLREEDKDDDVDKEIRFRMADGTKFEMSIFVNDSQAAMDQALEWIEDCRGKTHEFCIAPDEARLPSRVVDVGLDDGPVRLVQTRGEVASYVALSHCWGLKQIITTTTENLQEHLREVPFSKLSKTFQDAVTVTRRLGIRYIWIDSLCIIQNDRRDWEVEAARMMDVYSNSYLTIAATHSSSGDGGLFRNTPDFEVSGTTITGEPYQLFFRERIDHHLEVSLGDSSFSELDFGGQVYGHPTIKDYPLLTRAWVFQERMLSTRVLHFGRYELFFECRSDLQCECSGINNHGSSQTTHATVTKLVHADALDSLIPGKEWHVYASYYMAQLWRTLVTSYTCLGLTKCEDRLPAMGGLAKHMALRRKTKYLAGLWENTLSDDLIWAARSAGSTWRKPRPDPRPAPSWSWASVQSHVNYYDEILFLEDEDDDIDSPRHTEEDREPYQHFAKVEECWVERGPVDEYGTIEKGQVRLRGLLVKGVLGRTTVKFQGKEHDDYAVVFPDGLRFQIEADYLLEQPGRSQVLLGAEIWCLRMSQIQVGCRDHLFSLVLRRVNGAEGIFERIGCLLVIATPPPVDVIGPIYASAEEGSVCIE